MRGLIRVTVLAATIVATVGLGIGATTAIFAVIDAALLRPLPYQHPEQLVRIYTDTPPYKFRFSVADYQALEAQQTTFTKVAAYADRSMAYSDGDTAERLRGRLVTCDLLRPARHHACPRPQLHRGGGTSGRRRRGSSSATRSGVHRLGEPPRRDRHGGPARWRRLQPGRRTAADARPARARAGLLRRGAVGHRRAARARSSSSPSGGCPTRGRLQCRGVGAPRDQPAHFSALAVVVPGRAGDLGRDGPEDVPRRASSVRSRGSRSPQSRSCGSIACVNASNLFSRA